MLKFTRLSRKQFILLVGLTLAIILSIVYAAFRDNLHTVIPNQVYRSAQLTNSDLERITHLKNIKTVVNLRGVNNDEPWYQQEITQSRRLKLNHYDIALNSKRLPTHEQLIKLKQVLETAPKPLLIHCQSGIDRSGFVAAMALVLLKDVPLSQAEQQFSWRYFVTSNHTIGKLAFDDYQKWLTNHHLTSSKQAFSSWILTS